MRPVFDYGFGIARDSCIFSSSSSSAIARHAGTDTRECGCSRFVSCRGIPDSWRPPWSFCGEVLAGRAPGQARVVGTYPSPGSPSCDTWIPRFPRPPSVVTKPSIPHMSLMEAHVRSGITYMRWQGFGPGAPDVASHSWSDSAITPHLCPLLFDRNDKISSCWLATVNRYKTRTCLHLASTR